MQARVQPKARHEMDMTKGPILKNLIIFAIPLICSNILQLLFNAADTAILGIFVNEDAVGAVGATSSLITLITSMFLGFSAGATVVLSRAAGENDVEKARKVVGTAVCVSLIGGVFLMVIGVVGAKQFLTWMNCDERIINLSTTYLRIYFIGAPIMMFYNFTASILRAVGDTARPMIYLLVGGIVNVGLNVFCIVVLNMTVEGVAIATIASQTIAAILSLIAILRSDGYSKLKLKYLRIFKKQLKELVKIGLPSGIQGSLFSISNVIIASAINLYGKDAMAGSTIAGQFDGMVYTTGHAVSLACMSFVSQNFGAGKIDRIKKVVWISIIVSTVACLTVGLTFLALKDLLFGIMADDPIVLDFAFKRYSLVGPLYFLCGIMEVFSLTLRALGKSITAMIITLCGACIFRILWLNTVYLLAPSFLMIFYAWPISWVLTIGIYLFCYFPLIHKVEKDMPLKIPKKQTESGHIVVKQRTDLKIK